MATLLVYLKAATLFLKNKQIRLKCISPSALFLIPFSSSFIVNCKLSIVNLLLHPVHRVTHMFRLIIRRLFKYKVQLRTGTFCKL